MSKETDDIKKFFDDHSAHLFNLFATIDELEDENTDLKTNNTLLKAIVNRLLTKYERDEVKRRAVRREAEINKTG